MVKNRKMNTLKNKWLIALVIVCITVVTGVVVYAAGGASSIVNYFNGNTTVNQSTSETYTGEATPPTETYGANSILPSNRDALDMSCNGSEMPQNACNLNVQRLNTVRVSLNTASQTLAVIKNTWGTSTVNAGTGMWITIESKTPTATKWKIASSSVTMGSYTHTNNANSVMKGAQLSSSTYNVLQPTSTKTFLWRYNESFYVTATGTYRAGANKIQSMMSSSVLPGGYFYIEYRNY